MLDMRGCIANQIHPLPDITTQSTDLPGRTKGTFQETVGVHSLQPLTAQHIAFATRYVFDMTSIDQFDLKSLAFKYFKNGNPIDAGGFNGNRGNATSDQSVCHLR